LNQGYITISVDDGHPTDRRTADLLSKYGLQATFYVPGSNPERPVMSENEIREIARGFEMGGHTLHHVPLNSMPEASAWLEIWNGKLWIEQVLGSSVISFCYPRGKFNPRIARLVQRAGFLGARTCLFNLNQFPASPFRWGVSTHAHRHSRYIQIRHALLEKNFTGARNFCSIFRGACDWETHFLHALDDVDRNGGVAHLYLHSWEVDVGNEWNRLERVFQAVAARPHLRKVTNGFLYQTWKTIHDDPRES
jgi:peptidoglycan-N-acetylglucosamine deacetylase